jgi:hypothetical protein
MPEQRRKTDEPTRRVPGEDEGGPSTPDVEKPGSRKLLDRMKRVDPRTARRYRQRSGQ